MSDIAFNTMFNAWSHFINIDITLIPAQISYYTNYIAWFEITNTIWNTNSEANEV